MIGALWTGISGLSSQQKALDNESNNVANVNTIGYKSSRISFADQMYQDRIGKGSKILDAEKLYTQGNLKLTGVNYDMALSGDGFFTVLNNRSSGSSETLYTRAGNFRMGDNGTLQDAAGNEVQGWPMTALDTLNDVTSTNPNVKVFNTDYSKLLGSKIIKHDTYIETVTAKATDYSSTAKSDSSTIFSGAGMKTKAAKIADIEAAITDYTNWLQKLKDEPDGLSATSISQISEINYKTGTNGIISKDGDQVYAYINGNKISQNYVVTTASEEFKTSLLNTASASMISSAASVSFTLNSTDVKNNTRYSLTLGSGATTKEIHYDSDPTATSAEILAGLKSAIDNSGYIGMTATTSTAGISITFGSAASAAGIQKAKSFKSIPSYAQVDYDIEASRVATYKALADKISQVAGLSATMVSEVGGINDVLENGDTFKVSTNNADMRKGIIQVQSLIPGKEFIISEVGEISGTTTSQGHYLTTTYASAGSGIGALASSKNALAKLITGKQQDVYTTSDLGNISSTTPKTFTYSINIYDKELDKSIPVPNTGSTIPTEDPIVITSAVSIDDFIDQFNKQAALKTPKLSDYIEAKNINGNLVITTLDKNYDVEFSGSLKAINDDLTITGSGTAASPTVVSIGSVSNNTTYTMKSATKTITYTSDSDATQSEILQGLKTNASANGITSFTISNGTLRNSSAGAMTEINASGTPKDKSADYSGRAGAGAEFIEIINRVDQTASKDSLQLRLDTLGLSDTAFGEFSVDSTGLITMKQDGAEFAIGQVAIALFNNNQGLNPTGDNLLAKTNDSGEPIYNINNNKTAKIEGKTLELSTADLSESLVNLMVFQRAFEANAKSITTSDELLNTLINLKR